MKKLTNKNNMEQTAVDWLVNELKSLGIYSSTLKEKCEQAKEKEKQQIIDAYKQGLHDWVVNDLSTSTICRVSESYYTETYTETQMK
jgi:hypothetical protein